MTHTPELHSAVRPLTDFDTLGPLRDPMLIAAFSGGWGLTAGTALEHIVEQWDAQPIAEIDAEEFFDFTSTRPMVRVVDGERVIDWPENRLFLARREGVERDLLLFVGIEPALRWRTFEAALGSLMARLGVRESLLVSAFPGSTPHTRDTPLRFFGAHDEIASRLGVEAIVPDYQGPTSFTGFLAVEHQARGLRTSSLTAVAPFYIQVEPRPHAQLALVRALDATFGTETNVAAIEERVNAVDAQTVEALARSERYRELLTALEQQFDAAAPATADSRLDVDEIMRDVEHFFGSPGDTGGTSFGRSSRLS